MVTRHRVIVRALGALTAVLTVGLTACTGDGSSDEPDATGTTSSPSASPTPTAAPRPVVDACYRLTPAQLDEAQLDVAPVPCTQPHTTQTYLVAMLPDEVDPADGAAVATAADRGCRAALRPYLRATPARLALSRATYAWFVPSDDDLEAGARWLRCDVAVSRSDTTLLPLPVKAHGLLRNDGALDRYGRCARTGRAGIAAGEGGRACALPHTWRAVAARRLGAARDAYPGGAAVRQDVLSRCEQPAREFTDNSTADIDVGWLPPSRAAWASGDRFGLCWTRTRD
ncbi:septum formation family protein [Mumia qirimensis]|uniref:septum formation family protein n=1 Tax=Mumia qirimensis TaxID=3234852 RepID=UPI00351D7231